MEAAFVSSSAEGAAQIVPILWGPAEAFGTFCGGIAPRANARPTKACAAFAGLHVLCRVRCAMCTMSGVTALMQLI